MYLFAACCMTISANHLVRYSRNEMSLGNSGCRVLHGSLFGKYVDRRRELDSAGLGRVQRQIFAVIVTAHTKPSAYYVCITRFNVKEFYIPPVDCIICIL